MELHGGGQVVNRGEQPLRDLTNLYLHLITMSNMLTK